VGVGVRVPATMVVLRSAVLVGEFVAAAMRTSGSLVSASADTATYAPRQMTISTPRNKNEYARFSTRAIIALMRVRSKRELVLSVMRDA